MTGLRQTEPDLILAAWQRQRMELAAPRLKAAIHVHAAAYPRSRTFSRTRLTSLMMAAGDPYEAVPIGRQALINARHCDRNASSTNCRAWHAAEQHKRIGDVADLRQEITRLGL